MPRCTRVTPRAVGSRRRTTSRATPAQVNWLRHRWPEAIAFLFDPLTLILITLLSGACCVASVVVTAWAVRRLPVDYLSCPPDYRQRAEQVQRRKLLRNALGFFLLVLGLLMLLLTFAVVIFVNRIPGFGSTARLRNT